MPAVRSDGSVAGGATLASLSEIIGPLDAEQRQPLYQQLQRALRDAIEKRVWGPDEALPAERDLADEFAISRITVRKALDGLVGEGLLTRRQGAGTFVAARVEKSFSKLSSFTEDMISRGRKPHSDWLSRAKGAVTPEECLTLGLSPGSAGLSLRPHPLRRRRADGARILHRARLLPAVAETVGDSLYAALEKPGTRPVRALQRLRAVLFNAEQASLLGVRAGDAGPADRAARLSEERPAGRDHPSLSRRRLRLRRRAERGVVMGVLQSALQPEEATRMFAEAAEASTAVRAQIAGQRPGPARSSASGCARAAAVHDPHLRPRQLRPRGDLRQLPDRDPARAC